MKTSLRFFLFLLLAVVFAAGCSALPGLRVLTGEDTGDAAANNAVQNSELVMADKSGNTDPALTAAADRIEAATNSAFDIVEIRKDLTNDVFTVYMLFAPPSSNTTQDQFVNSLRRAIELTWQGTLQQSQGSDVLRVVFLDVGQVPTLDNGISFIGAVFVNTQIARADAIAYLNQRPTSLDAFANLVAEGKLVFEQPQQTEFYQGQPNHPVFLLGQIAASQGG